MAYYEITITETHSRSEIRAADSYEEALKIVKAEYDQKTLTLDERDFQDVNFE